MTNLFVKLYAAQLVQGSAYLISSTMHEPMDSVAFPFFFFFLQTMGTDSYLFDVQNEG